MNFQESTNAANAFTNKEQSLITSEYKVDPNLKKILMCNVLRFLLKAIPLNMLKLLKKALNFL